MDSETDNVVSVDDHRFIPKDDRPWERCRVCGLSQAAHLDPGEPYEPTAERFGSETPQSCPYLPPEAL